MFAFRSRRADRLKLLYWDGTGLVPLPGSRLRSTTMKGGDQGRGDGAEP